MELRHLRYLIAVAEEGTFVRAAERLRVAQPALSRQFRHLENEVGVDLVERGPRAVRLTPAGEACLRCAREILHDTAAALERARRSSRGVAGQCGVCVGKVPIWTGFTARLIARMQRDYPDVTVTIIEASLRRQWDALRAREGDVGIGVSPAPEYSELEHEPIFVEVFDGALVSASHPLAGRRRARLASVASETLVTLDRSIPGYSALHEQLTRANFVPAALREVADVSTAAALVAAGVGWTIFPASRPEWAPTGTVVIPLDDFRVPISFSVISRVGESRGVVLTVVNAIRELGRDTAAISIDAQMQREAVIETFEVDRVPVALELRHLRYFVAVGEEKSVGRAAERLRLTQPGLSRQVRDLEREVGATLFDRRARGVDMTPAGDALYTDAHHILETADRIPAEAHRARRGEVGRCVIAAIPSPVVANIVARALRECAAELPDVEIAVSEISTPQQPAALLSASVDLGVGHAFSALYAFEAELGRHLLVADAMTCAVLSPRHPLASRRMIALAELAESPFIFISRSMYPAFYDSLMQAFARHDFYPRIDQAHDGLETTWSLAREGRGWCIGFRSYLRYPPADLVAVPLEHFEVPWSVDVLHRRDETRGSVLAVLEHIRRSAELENAPALARLQASA